MRVLFVHPYFPGQFKNIVSHFRQSETYDIVAFHRGLKDGREMPLIDGMTAITYGEEVQTSLSNTNPLHGTERFLREAASMAYQAHRLRDLGWTPDLVYSHSGWGSTAFLHDVFPRAKYIKYCEWFYNNTNESTEFLTDERDLSARIQTNLYNIPILSEMVRADALVAPTEWQKSQFPSHIAKSIEVIPDGIDTDVFKPDPDATFSVENGRIFRAGDPIVTYVARGADPFRGFEPFMAALSILQSRDPSVEAVIVGDRKIYYGAGQGTEQHFDDVMKRVDFDRDRTHLVGRIPYTSYRRLLQVSAAHVYLTAPFVLSWSALEAMSTGCAVIGSNTAPVKEFIESGVNGLLADFFDVEEIARTIATVLSGGSEIEAIREAARRTVLERWSLNGAVEGHLAVISALSLSSENYSGRVRVRRK